MLNKDSKENIKNYSNHIVCTDTTNTCNVFRPSIFKNAISGKITLPSKDELSGTNSLKRKEYHR